MQDNNTNIPTRYNKITNNFDNIYITLSMTLQRYNFFFNYPNPIGADLGAPSFCIHFKPAPLPK